MSATNATTNYALPIFIGTDKPAWLVDWNTAMTDIDAAIKGVDTDVQGAIVDISGLNSTVASHTSTLSTISGQITVINTNLNTATGNINTINSLIGNGTPTTTDQTLIGAINELHANQGDLSQLQTTDKSSLVAAINEILGGGQGIISASIVSYSNSASGLSASNVQNAIDEVVSLLPATTSEKKSNILTAGSTSVQITFTEQTIGATTLIDVYTSIYGVNPLTVSTTSNAVVLTFEAQASDMNVVVVVNN